MLKYQFPAVKGCQAGKDYYICMVPLGLMSKIFVTDSSDVPAEYRAQRKLNEARIPEICGYILSNRDSYVFSALAASVDGDMKFVPADSNENAGILEIDMTASFLINDGQHRKAAIEAAIAEDESLKEETISIVLYKDQGLQRSQQMFTDLNKHAVTTSKSLNTLYESKDPVALITKNLEGSHAAEDKNKFIQFDVYYCCALIGMAAGQIDEDTSELKDLVERYPVQYRDCKAQIAGLLVASEARRLGIDTQSSKLEQIMLQYLSNNDTLLSEDGIKTLNAYALKGYRLITDYPLFDKPTSREEFLDAFNVAMQFYEKKDS